jgi:hypothetical protein
LAKKPVLDPVNSCDAKERGNRNETEEKKDCCERKRTQKRKKEKEGRRKTRGIISI